MEVIVGCNCWLENIVQQPPTDIHVWWPIYEEKSNSSGHISVIFPFNLMQ